MTTRFKVLFIYPNTEMQTLVPINLSLLSACLQEAGIEVALFDTTYYKWEDITFEQKKVELLQLKPFSYEEKGIKYKDTDMYEDLKSMVANYKPDLIAITLVEDTYDLGMSLLKSVRAYHAPVIAGGVFVTFSAADVIENQDVDMVCLGEGEEALIELCEKMTAGEDYSSVKNLWIRTDGGVIKNPLRKLTDINELPYISYDIFEKERLYRPMQGKMFRMIHVEVDRGCPYDCTYCEAPHLRKFFKQEGCGNYYRRKKTERVIEEMKFLHEKYSPDYINFNAESFLARPVSELLQFAEKYRDVGLPFWCQSRPEDVTEEKIKIIKEMNCQNLQFGIEHGNEDFRARVLNRKNTNRQIVDAFKIVEKYNISYTVNNIIGFPDETRELVFDTIRLNRQINPVTMNCYMFTPYKGTRLYRYCLNSGYLEKDVKVHQALDGVPLKMNSISYEELKGLQRTFSLYARFPEEMFDKIRIAEKFNVEGNKIFNQLKNEFYQKYF